MLSDDNRQGKDIHGHINQWADFIFTPFGRNHSYKMHQNATIWQKGGEVVLKDKDTGSERKVKSKEWSSALYPASITGVISEQELANARVDMGENKYLQEYECSFDAAVEGSIFGRALDRLKAQGGFDVVRYNPHMAVNTAWDLGFDDATAIWFFNSSIK